MKRTVVLNEIKLAGYDGDTKRAALISAQQGIGKAASRKAYLDGTKMKERGEPRPKSARDK